MADGTKTLVCPHKDCGVEHVISYTVSAAGVTLQDWHLVVTSDDLADVYAHAWVHDAAQVADE